MPESDCDGDAAALNDDSTKQVSTLPAPNPTAAHPCMHTSDAAPQTGCCDAVVAWGDDQVARGGRCRFPGASSRTS